MSRHLTKTLTLALCAAVIGISAVPASALEIQYDYCKDFTDSEQHAICESVLAELQQFDRDDLLELEKAAVAAVEQQIPKFNALKEVPYAKGMAMAGNPCGLGRVPDTNPWNMNCGPWSAKMVLAAEIADLEGDLDVIGANPTWQALMSKPFEEVINLGKNDARYTSDEEFRTGVDIAEQNYTVGMTLLREAVVYFDESAEVDSMTVDELITFLKALPEYNLYKLEYVESKDDYEATIARYYTGLYSTYADAKYAALYEQEVGENDYGDAGIYNGAIRNYAWLVTAATTVDPNFKVDLSSFQDTPANVPTAPNTGLTAAELSAAIVGVALGGIAAFAGIIGLAKLFRLYFFSGLKRRK